MFFVFKVFSDVAFPVVPSTHPFPVHLAGLPFPIILLPVSPLINPFSLDEVVHKISIISGSVSPNELPCAMFLPFVILSSVPCSIYSGLYALAMFLVVRKLSFINGPVHMIELPYSIELVLLELAFIDIPRGVHESAEPRRFVVFPSTFINRPVSPFLFAFSIPFCELVPLTNIDRLVRQSHRAELSDLHPLFDVQIEN